jgi:hypothetical protein
VPVEVGDALGVGVEPGRQRGVDGE